MTRTCFFNCFHKDTQNSCDTILFIQLLFIEVSHFQEHKDKNKKTSNYLTDNLTFISVGMTRFELATTRPPDEYSKPG